MKYLKVFTDFVQSIEMLSDAETGRLFRAMLLYAKTGEEPTINGNERFMWPAAKMNIDKQIEAYGNKVVAVETARMYNPNNSPKQADNSLKQTDNSSKQNCSELNQTEENKEVREETEKGNERERTKEKDYPKDKEEIQETKEKNTLCARERKVFVKPTVAEVDAYCRSRNNFVDAEKFVNFYESKGWKVGNQPMKDWKAAVRTWEKGDRNGVNKSVSAKSPADNRKPEKDYSYLYDT